MVLHNNEVNNLKKKLFVLLTAMLSILGIAVLSNVHADKVSNSELQRSVKIQKQNSNPTWTTIVNAKGKYYQNLNVKSSFQGNQTIIPNSVEVQYGKIKGGHFVTQKTLKDYQNFKVVGNNVEFNFTNVNTAIKITYQSTGAQTGTLTNTVTVQKNNDKNVLAQKTTAINLKGNGNFGSSAAPAPTTVTGNTADSAVITDSTGKVINHDTPLNKWVSYTLTYNWALPNNMSIKDGQKLNFYLPSNVQVRQNTTFNVTEGDNGPVIGTFSIKKGSDYGTLTFNSYLQAHKEINRHGKIVVEVNGKEDNKPTVDWKMNKAGWVNSSNQPTWNIVVNPEGKSYKTLTVNDTLGDNQQIVPGSIIVEYGHWDKTTGQFIVDSQSMNPSYTINGNKITFNFSNVNSAIQIIYTAKPNHSGILHNSATVTGSNDMNVTVNAEISYSGNGSMTGVTPACSSSSISSTKSSSKASSSVKASSSSQSVKSSSSSKMSSSSVVKSSTHSSSEMSSSSSSQKVPNTPYGLTNFTVNKKWNSNNHPSSVTVDLLANGQPTGKTVTLSDANNWTYTWEDLPAKDSEGNTITYSAKEENVPGYKPSYSPVTSGTTSTTIWLPASHWEDGHKFIMTTSPAVGNVNALQDCGKNWQWNGHTITVSSNSQYPRFITDQEAHKDNGSFIWTTQLYATNVHIDHLNGTFTTYTLIGNNGEIASLQGAQDMVDYNHRSQTNCQWFFGGYQGGQNQPAVPQSSWNHVMGGADFYYPLSEGGTGDGNHKNIPLWYAYEQQTVTANKQTQTITNNVD